MKANIKDNSQETNMLISGDTTQRLKPFSDLDVVTRSGILEFHTKESGRSCNGTSQDGVPKEYGQVVSDPACSLFNSFAQNMTKTNVRKRSNDLDESTDHSSPGVTSPR